MNTHQSFTRDLEIYARNVDRAGDTITAYTLARRLNCNQKTARKILERLVYAEVLGSYSVSHRPNVQKTLYFYTEYGLKVANFVLGYACMNELFEQIGF